MDAPIIIPRRKWIGDVSKLAAMLMARRACAQLTALPLYAGSKPSSNGLLAGTLGYWKLDDVTTGAGFVWTDATGNGWGATQHGTVLHDTTQFVIIASAADSIAGTLAASASIDTRSGTTPFSVSLWLQDNGNSFGNNPFAFDDTTNRNWSLYMGNSSGGSGGSPVYVSLQTWQSGGTYDNAITSNAACHTNVQFDHIVAGYDGTNRFIVINNGSRVTSAVSSVKRGTAPLTIMSRGDNIANFIGYVDEVAYFNFALSATQIGLIYNGGAGLPFSSYS